MDMGKSNKRKDVIALSDITPNPDNPRHIKDGKFAELVDSISQFSKMMKLRPMVLDENWVVLGGNMRLKALEQMGKTEIPREWVIIADDLTEAEKREFVIKDNVAFGEWDWEIIANEWPEAGEWGLDVPVFANTVTGLTDEDDVPEVPEQPITKLGDIWILGDHRLMCGDSTNATDIQRLLQGTQPDCIWTDPPYGMNAVSKSGVLSKNYGTDILGDDTNEAALASFPLWEADAQFWFGANYYPECLPSSGCWVVWDKNNGGSDQADAELCWTNHKGVVRIYKQASEKHNRVHPTQKPAELVEWCFERWKVGTIVADPFSGSGVVFISCEKTNRKCYGMELDPKYCDVIVKRWEDFTGKKAELQKIS